jgi:SAM-dependent methyltransferase
MNTAMTNDAKSANIDPYTVDGFGEEWAAFDQADLPHAEQRRIFDAYFEPFPFQTLPAGAEGFDFGCGSGRWADMVHDRVGTLHCIDASQKALNVCRARLAEARNVRFHVSGPDNIPLAARSQDFGYSLGVLHHIPDTAAAMQSCVDLLKPGAPFLVYLYYDFDNRPAWFRALWKASDAVRRVISDRPFAQRKLATTLIAGAVYWPLARTSLLLEKAGARVGALPLSFYRNASFYSMRTDALDRFGTRLEQRFSRVAIAKLMEGCGLRDVRFREGEPYWVACGRKTGA